MLAVLQAQCVVIAIGDRDVGIAPVNQFWWQRLAQAVVGYALPQHLALMEWSLVLGIAGRRQEVGAVHQHPFNAVR